MNLAGGACQPENPHYILTYAHFAAYPGAPMKPRFSTVSSPLFGLLILVTLAPLSGGCETFDLNWTPIEDTVSLYSLSRPEFVDLPGAFDFYGRRAVVVEAPKLGEAADFDMAISEVNGEFVLLPAALFATFDIDPGIAIDSSGTPFDDLAEAPREGYITDEVVPVRTDVVYTVRTRRDRGGCSRYGKFEILEVDPDGMVTFRQIRNRLCNDRELIPPDDE